MLNSDIGKEALPLYYPQEHMAAEGTAQISEASKSPKGFKAFVPLVLATLLMPGVAFATLKFLPELAGVKSQLLEKVTSSSKEDEVKVAKPKIPSRRPVPITAGQVIMSSAGSKAVGAPGITVTNIPKMLKMPEHSMAVKLRNTRRTHFVLAQIYVAGDNTDELIAKLNMNQPALYESITNHLGSKSIADLTKPGARNVVRSEILSLCTSTLGDSVQEVLLPLFIVQ